MKKSFLFIIMTIFLSISAFGLNSYSDSFLENNTACSNWSYVGAFYGGASFCYNYQGHSDFGQFMNLNPDVFNASLLVSQPVYENFYLHTGNDLSAVMIMDDTDANVFGIIINPNDFDLSFGPEQIQAHSVTFYTDGYGKLENFTVSVIPNSLYFVNITWESNSTIRVDIGGEKINYDVQDFFDYVGNFNPNVVQFQGFDFDSYMKKFYVGYTQGFNDFQEPVFTVPQPTVLEQLQCNPDSNLATGCAAMDQLGAGIGILSFKTSFGLPALLLGLGILLGTVGLLFMFSQLIANALTNNTRFKK